jgi:hypothetical protein
MDLVLGVLAALSAAMFAGGALYISLVEHPARLGAGIPIALAEFRPSYRRAAPWQASMAAISLLAGVGAALTTATLAWAVGGLAVGAVIPFTLLAIMPTTRRLLGADPVSEDEAAQLLHRWGRLHWVRSWLGLAGFLVFLGALLAR